MCRHFALLAAITAMVILGTPVMANEQTDPTSNVSTASAAPTDAATDVLRGPLRINGQTFSDVRPVSSRMARLEAAANITDNNGIDEVYVKDANGKLYVAYGYYSNTENIAKTGMPGHMGGQMVEVVHVNNEMNTYSEIAMSGVDDLKGVFKSLIEEHFPKLLTALGLGGAAIIGRQLLLHPLAGQTMGAVIRAALPAMGTGLMWAGGGTAILAALWPTVIKPILTWIKKTYLERSKENNKTIAMVTAETAAQLEENIVIGERHEATTRENINDVLRRTEIPGGAANAPTSTTGGFRGTGGVAISPRTATGTGDGAGTATNRGTGTPVTSTGAPILGARPSNTPGDEFSDLRIAR